MKKLINSIIKTPLEEIKSEVKIQEKFDRNKLIDTLEFYQKLHSKSKNPEHIKSIIESVMKDIEIRNNYIKNLET